MIPTASLINGDECVLIADIAPFFRYAVGPTSGSHPAIPFYSLKNARAFFDEARRELPWAACSLYKRTLFQGIETIEEYMPS